MTFTKVNNQAGNRSFNHLFEELLNELPFGGQYKQFPPVNINETSDGYHFEMLVPGREKSDFKVSIENGLLTISFEKKADAAVEGVKSVRKEFSFKSFKRSFTVDEKINAEGIQAKYEQGLLKLYLPKKEQAPVSTKEIVIS
jgi:HSP20 family protein